MQTWLALQSVSLVHGKDVHRAQSPSSQSNFVHAKFGDVVTFALTFPLALNVVMYVPLMS